MHITITGRHIDLGEALQTHVREKLGPAIAKYYEPAVDARVVFSKNAHLIKAEVTVHVGAGIDAHAEAEDAEIYAAFDAMLVKAEKQLRRDKRKRRNHHDGVARKGAELA